MSPTTTTDTASTEAKRFATLRAKFALRGHTFQQLREGPGAIGYLAARWGMERHLPTLDDADKFLLQVGGGRHDL